MATFTTKSIVDDLIAKKGLEPGDPPVHMIVEYDTPEGMTVWGVTWEQERNNERYLIETGFVLNPRVIFRRE